MDDNSDRSNMEAPSPLVVASPTKKRGAIDVASPGNGHNGDDDDDSIAQSPIKKLRHHHHHRRRQDTPMDDDNGNDEKIMGTAFQSSNKENGLNGQQVPPTPPPPPARVSISNGNNSNSDSSIHDNNNSNRKKSKASAAPAAQSSLLNGALNNSTADGTTRNINVPGQPAQAGLISRIYVENFMCHRKLTVELCRNINFIYGQNGSGKSAILAAIQICLGAKAGRTHRARNLKDLVRKDGGPDVVCARIRVTLTNKGEDAYRPDLYGDAVTVERTIALKGGFNGFKLLDGQGIEKSRSRKDLDDMLDKLNIQVENPVALLDQEESKKFLTGKASDKYQFFMKATELERVDISYANTLEEVETLNSQAQRMDNTMDGDREIVTELRKNYKQHQEVAKLETKRAKIEVDGAWAGYKLALTELEKIKAEMRTFEERAEKKREKLSQAVAASQTGDEGYDERRDRMQELNNEATIAAEAKRDLEQRLKRAMEPHKALHRQIKALRKEEEKAMKNLQAANARLQKKRDEIAAAAGSAESDEARRNQRLRDAEAQREAAQGKYNETKQATSDAFNQYDFMEPEIQAARGRIAELDHQLNGIKSTIRSLESANGNSLTVFGERCAKVRRQVDELTRRGKFRGPVLGPLGSYCKVNRGKEEFAFLAECALGHGVLDRFLVTNDQDRRLLQKIRRDVGCQLDCGVFQVAQHPRYRIPDPPPFDGIETVSTVLSIDNDLVFNCLVDNGKIDERALARSKDESELRLLHTDANGRNSIRGGKIKDVYFLPKGDNWKVTKGGYKQLTSNTRRVARTIGVDNSEVIREKREEFDSLKAERNTKDQEFTRRNHEHTELKKLWNAKKRELPTWEAAIDAANEIIDSIKAEQETVAERDVDTAAEEEEVVDTQSNLDEVKDRHQRAKEESEQQAPEIETIKAELAEITARNEKILADLDAADKETTKYVQMKSQQEEKVTKEREKLMQYEEIISQHAQKVRAEEEEVEEYLVNARRVQYNFRMLEEKRKLRDAGEGGETQMSEYSQDPTEEDLETIDIPDLEGIQDTNYYTARIKRADEKIEKEKKRNISNREDEATAYDKYVRAKNMLKSKEIKLQETKTLVAKLEKDLEIRRARWQQFRAFMSTQSSVRFDEILQTKGSSGCVDFDHDEQALNLVVQKDSNDQNSQQSDVKALSGGERSYTTIALLLALGELLETPFRVMDEFDVFLDPMTRKIIIEQLITVAKSMKHRQFIFITPQDVSSVNTDGMIKILKMKPPERREQAGGPTQQTLDF